MSSKPWEHVKSSGSEGSGGDPLAARFVSSLDVDKRLYEVDITGSLAHARMLKHVDLISGDDLAEIERGLAEIKAEIDEHGDAWPGWKVELEDVHMCIEAALIDKIGDPGRKLHTGRSRNDQVATDLQLWIDLAERELHAKHDFLEAEFFQLAERDGKYVLPSYTHLQRAQPVVVGGELVAWANAINIAGQRYSSFDSEQWYCHLGSGAIAGSSLPLDRKRTVTELQEIDDFKFFGPSASSIYSTASRDKACDFVYALSMSTQWLSRWSEQWIIYSSTEFGFITLDDRYTTGSSMMPQKQNPDMLELIRGKCGTVYGHLVALLTMLKGLPIGYNRDLQEDKRHVFGAFDVVCDCLDMATHIVQTTRFNEERIKAGLDRGFLDATSLAEYLVTRGVPFRTAHQIVGALVKQCTDAGKHKLAQLSVDEMNNTAAPHVHAGLTAVADDVYDWLGPENVVKRYQTHGNAGLTGFEQQLAAWKQRRGDAEPAE
jgi:argininosuccinate lyase